MRPPRKIAETFVPATTNFSGRLQEPNPSFYTGAMTSPPSNRSKNLARTALLVAALTPWGCATPETAPARGGFIRGRVIFDDGPPARHTQATMTEVAVAATVSLIDTDTNETKATTLTTSGGAFLLAWDKSFVPGSTPYYLEAVKGLNNNAVGHDAIRVRTMVVLSGNTLADSLTGPTGADVSRLTTTIAILADLLQLSGNARLGLMSQVVTLPNGSLGAPGISAGVMSQSDINTALGLVTTIIENNIDPIASLDYDNGPVLRASAGLKPPSVASLDPSPATAGSRIVINGADFGSSSGRVTVALNGVTLPIQSFASNRIEVVLPSNAASGLLSVTNLLGKAVVNCDVVPKVSGSLPGTSF